MTVCSVSADGIKNPMAICSTLLGDLILQARDGFLVRCDFADLSSGGGKYSSELLTRDEFGFPAAYGEKRGDSAFVWRFLKDGTVESHQEVTSDDSQSWSVLDRTARQLEEYFAGTRTTFDVPLAPAGTPFQQRVWNQLRAIPFAETISYGELAQRLDQPGASRAVGAANGRNPISLVIPCHRVIGSGGQLAGYSSGITRKRWLLEWEQSIRG